MDRFYLLIVFFISIASSSGQIYQQMVFFSEIDQQGTSTTLFNDQDPAETEVQNAKSFCVELGLWELSVREDNHDLKKVFGGAYGAKYCLNTKPDTWSITAVKYLGERDLSNSSLTIFENARFTGATLTYYAPEEPLDLDSGVTFSSYFITGTNNFEVYSENFTGVVTCLRTLKDGASTHGAQVQAYLETPLTIKSYRQGCEGDGDAGVTRPPRESGSDKVLLHNYLLLSITFILGFRYHASSCLV